MDTVGIEGVDLEACFSNFVDDAGLLCPVRFLLCSCVGVGSKVDDAKENFVEGDNRGRSSICGRDFPGSARVSEVTGCSDRHSQRGGLLAFLDHSCADIVTGYFSWEVSVGYCRI